MDNQKILLILDVKQANPRWTNYVREIANQNYEVDLLIHHSGKHTLDSEIVDHPKIRIFYSFFISIYGRNRLLTKLLYVLTKYFSSNRTFLSIYDFIAIHAFLFKAKRLFMQYKYRLIITSSSPFYTHIVGSKLRQTFDTKWVADYRDLWSLNHTNTDVCQDQLNFEKASISCADACLTVSRGLKADLKSIFPGPIHVVYNGYRFLEPTKELLSEKNITFEYTGQIYKSNQNISGALDFFSHSKYLKEANFSVNFSGSSGVYISNYFKEKKVKIPKNFNCVGQVSNSEAIKRQKTASFLLFLSWGETQDKGVVPGKIFEYIASGVPILVIGRTSQIEISKIIKASGYYICINSQADLDRLILAYYQGTLKIPQRNVDFIRQFQYSEQSRTLIKIFNDLVKEQLSVDLDKLQTSLE